MKSSTSEVCVFKIVLSRKVLRASLQRPINNQILTFSAVVDFCNSSIAGVIFMVVQKQDMIPVREKLDARYKLGDTIYFWK